MLTIKISLIISAVLALTGAVQWTAEKISKTRKGNLLEVVTEAGEFERERIAAEERLRIQEEKEQARRTFGLDVMITHGAAFGGLSATCQDGRARKGQVPLDQIMMYGRQSNGKDYTYYIEDQGIAEYANAAGIRPIHIFCTLTDRTEQILLEKEEQEMANKYRRIFEQSLTGLATANHKVIPVMTTRKATMVFDTVRRWMAKSRSTPRMNSKAANSTDVLSVTQSGRASAMPSASM